ncbi:phosphopantetheine-binding protein [Plantactinospora sp. WMMC1484]|uniref:phosphopantetheine-binding protein n=1 Tax=Plantactinospora sp. WMMC1484 TaxID=3404122 RepID=UPI003BF50993
MNPDQAGPAAVDGTRPDGTRPDDTDGTGSGGAAETSSHEETILRLVGELLERDDVGPDDDFFVLGGNSLLAARLLWSVYDTFGVEVPVRVLFDEPTVSGLARAVEELVRADVAQAGTADAEPQADPAEEAYQR